VLKNPLTYEIMTPESVGLKNTNLVLGKLSGRAAFQDRMKELGFELCANAPCQAAHVSSVLGPSARLASPRGFSFLLCRL
jgi:isopropylmalate/homocitrate/citramalate synthase